MKIYMIITAVILLLYTHHVYEAKRISEVYSVTQGHYKPVKTETKPTVIMRAIK